MGTITTTQSVFRRSEILIAVIGLVGVVVTAFASNWDRLFPDRGVITASYSGYRPTGNFDTELRYFFEITGQRALLERMPTEFAQGVKMTLLAENPDEAAEIEKSFSIRLSEMPTVEDMFKLIIPVYRKYFTVGELQELNKFYSTESMQAMVAKMPLVMQELGPIAAQVGSDLQKRLKPKLQEELLKGK